MADNPHARLSMLFVLGLLVLVLVGQAVQGFQLLDSNKTSDNQLRTAERTECARRVTAEAEKRWRVALGDYVAARDAGDKVAAARAVARVRTEPDVAELVNELCPAPIATATPEGER